MKIWRGSSYSAEGVNWLDFETKRDVFARTTIPGKKDVRKYYSGFAVYIE